jgi:transcription initiation factor TFIIIB Brf1 subunit/transcription initiation factor TFIIB
MIKNNMMPLQRTIPKIACNHKQKNRLVTDSHEVLCSDCGVVLEMDNQQEHTVESTLNLFQQVENGGRATKIEAAKHIHEQKFLSSTFSNACSKLGLPSYAFHDAWRTFSRLERNTDINANAAIALFSLFTSCRRYSIPKTQNEIRNAIAFAFSVKRVPTLLKSCLFVHSLVLTMTSKEQARIAFQPVPNSFEYYLNIHINRIQRNVDRETLRDNARRIARSLTGNNEYRARIAVQLIKGELC